MRYTTNTYGEKMMYEDQPVSKVIWVDINKVQANDYNPNSVATSEMRLLYTSILQDGFTQPVYVRCRK